MSVDFTFGALGDIISVCLIVKELVAALDDSKGSSAEYQQLIRELRALEHVLLQVDLVWRICESNIELNALRETSRRAAGQCRETIKSFLKKIKRYNPNLQESGSGSGIRDAVMKVRWHIGHSEELTKFRAEVNAHYSALNMLLLTANLKLTNVNDAKLQARLCTDGERYRVSSTEHVARITDIQDRMEENNRLILSVSVISTKIMEALRLEWLRQLGAELKDFMRKIFCVNVATYKAVLAIQEGLASSLERTLYQEPFVLEDAIGRVTPVHTQFINSWEAFDAVLELRFQNYQGFEKVQKKEYVIEEAATQKEIYRSRCWESSFFPGQKVVMSMRIEHHCSNPRNRCPMCKQPSANLPGTESHCNRCGMFYKRVFDSSEIDLPAPGLKVTSSISGRLEKSSGKNHFEETPITENPLPDDRKVALSSKKRKFVKLRDHIKDFKRIRVVYPINKFKQGPSITALYAKHAFPSGFVPFQGSMTSPASARKVTMTIPFPVNSNVSSCMTPSRPKPSCGVRESDDYHEDDKDMQRSNNSEEADKYDKKISDVMARDDPAIDDSAEQLVRMSSLQDTRLVDAARVSNTKQVEFLLRQRGNLQLEINTKDAFGFTALHYASSTNDVYIARILLNNGADDMALADDDDATPLHRASLNGNLEMVELLSKRRATLWEMDCDGRTALHLAAIADCKPVIEVLLARGVSINVMDHSEWTPLHCAASGGHTEAVVYLLHRGADTSIRDFDEKTAFDLAVQLGHEKTADIIRRHLLCTLDFATRKLVPVP